MPGNERRPDGVKRIRTASDRGVGNLKSGSTLPPTADLLADLDALCDSLRGYLVVQVVIADDGRRRTTVYRSAAAAQRAVERARARGRTTHVSLCQLLPVGVVTGLEVA